MQRSKWCLAVLAIGGVGLSGCVSGSTWRAWEETSQAIRDAAPNEAGGEDAPADGVYAFRTCADVARSVLDAYPGIDAQVHRARSALAQARAAGALPAPSARFQVWGFPIGDPSLADRQGMYMLGLTQQLPPAGSLDGRARALVEEARVALGSLAETRREVSATASHACVDWAEAAERRAQTTAWIVILDRMREDVGAQFGAGGGMLADLPRIDRERATAERMLRRAEGDERRAEASLRAQLGAAGESSLGDAPALPSAAPAVDRDALLSVASSRGALVSARARVASADARIEASEAAASVPTFMVGAMYMQTPQAPAGLGLELTMTLPWLWSGEADELEAARESALAALADTSSIEHDIAVDLSEALGELETASATLVVLREREAPAARRAVEAALEGYAAGTGDLLDWLDAARAIRELDVEEAELRGALGHALTEVESIVGAPLTDGAVPQ